MADTKMKALIAIGRLIIALVVGGAIAFYWNTFRPAETYNDPWYYAYGAGFICFVMVFLMLSKLKGGGD